MSDQPQVLLRPGANGQSKPFAAGHAERLLNYPGTQWQRVNEDDSIADAAKALGIAKSDVPAFTQAVKAAAPKPKAAAAKPKAAAAAPVLPEVDTTGQSTSI